MVASNQMINTSKPNLELDGLAMEDRVSTNGPDSAPFQNGQLLDVDPLPTSRTARELFLVSSCILVSID